MNSDHFIVPGFFLFLLNGSFGPSRIECSDIYFEQEGGVAAVGADPSTLLPASAGIS
jgi:hypothetical protein